MKACRLSVNCNRWVFKVRSGWRWGRVGFDRGLKEWRDVVNGNSISEVGV